MNTLFNVIFAHKCRSTHHKIALDALRFLEGPEAERRRNLFVARHEIYFAGAKAPDTTFKDFTNHVLHVRDNYWGGAPKAARKWYDEAVAAMREKRWDDAVYAAGVMSHYFTDPHQPFHTGQTEEEGAIHRAVEWSFTKSYHEFQAILEEDLGGYPVVETPATDAWLEDMIRDGAEAANVHYRTVIEHYDLKAGRKNPPAGLDQEIKDRISGLVGLAVVGLARVLDRAFAEAAVSPPRHAVTLAGYIESLDVPLHWVTSKMTDAAEAQIVAKIYREVKKTGKAVKSLPEDDKVVRARHAVEVLRTPLDVLDAQPLKPLGAKHGSGETARPRRRMKARTSKPVRSELPPSPVAAPSYAKPKAPRGVDLAEAQPSQGGRITADSPVVDAPSIGPKTAQRLAAIKVKTIGDLLALDPANGAAWLKTRWITADVVRDWQAQSRLVLEVDKLFGHDAQILVALGVRDTETLASEDARGLLKRIAPFAESAEGQRIIRSGKTPDLEEVSNWITWARKKGAA